MNEEITTHAPKGRSSRIVAPGRHRTIDEATEDLTRCWTGYKGGGMEKKPNIPLLRKDRTNRWLVLTIP